MQIPSLYSDVKRAPLDAYVNEKGSIVMNSLSRVLLALVFVATIVIAQPNCAYACSCVPPGTPAEELSKSDAVFLGKVIAVNLPNKPIESSSDVTTVTFETSQVWKGQVTKTLVLTTPGSSASCGVTFEQDQEYVVYARVNEGVLATNLCSRTNTASNAADDIAALHAGQAPEINAAGPSQLPSTGATDDMFAFGGTPLLVAFGTVTLVLGVVLVAVGRVRGAGKRF